MKLRILSSFLCFRNKKKLSTGEGRASFNDSMSTTSFFRRIWLK